MPPTKPPTESQPGKQSFSLVVASGKGGTGKTTISTSLAVALAETGRSVTYLDADVEAPNGHLFLKPELGTTELVTMPLAQVNHARCTACGRCAEVCRYGAVVLLGKRAVVFPELCHGCGGCALVCKPGAITEEPRRLGVVETGRAGTIRFIQGRLDVGQPVAPAVIRAAQARLPGDGVEIIDSPPGTACAATAAAEGADYALLVTEPTPFGQHDLELAVELMRALGIPCGVVVNRADARDTRIHRYCTGQEIEVVMEIPDDRCVAEVCSRGEVAAEVVPGYAARLAGAFGELEGRLRR